MSGEHDSRVRVCSGTTHVGEEALATQTPAAKITSKLLSCNMQACRQ